MNLLLSRVERKKEREKEGEENRKSAAARVTTMILYIHTYYEKTKK